MSVIKNFRKMLPNQNLNDTRDILTLMTHPARLHSPLLSMKPSFLGKTTRMKWDKFKIQVSALPAGMG